MKSKILTRVVFGLAMIAVLIGLFWLDWRLEVAAREGVSEGFSVLTLRWLVMAVVLATLMLAGFRELSRLAAAAGISTLKVSGSLAIIAMLIIPHLREANLLSTVWGWQAPTLLRVVCMTPNMLFVFALAAIFFEQMCRRRTEGAMQNIAVTVLAVAYLGVCGSFIYQIRMNWGIPALVLFLVAVKSTDIGAYFTGTAIGKHKLIPWLSPGKSWEGLAGGLVAAWVFSDVTFRLLHIDGLTPLKAGLFGVAVGLVGQFGDLCESLLKRSAKIKDSGAVLPEFGGVLDIIDSPLMAAPAAVMLLSWLVGK